MACPILLIHGAWLTPRAWAPFRARYAARGMTVLAPAWPGLDGVSEPPRAAPAHGLGGLTLEGLVEAFARRAQALEAPPILIGHGLGGLVVQRLLDRGLGACGVAIATLPPVGLPARTRAAWSLRRMGGLWRGGDGLATLTFERFSTLFAHTLSEAERRRAYAEHVAPAPARLVRQALLTPAGPPCARRRPPLLLIAGDVDRVAPPTMVRQAAHRQRRVAARTDLQGFSGRSHWLCLEPGWEEVADFALAWALANGRP